MKESTKINRLRKKSKKEIHAWFKRKDAAPKEKKNLSLVNEKKKRNQNRLGAGKRKKNKSIKNSIKLKSAKHIILEG